MDASEEARCLALIRQAFYSRWDRPAWTSSLKKMCLSVQFGPGGRVVGYSLTHSSGDAAADRTVLSAASKVSYVRGLSSTFLDKHGSVLVRFEVTPE
ncbi:MAG: cell envelope integrity protein TolA [Kiritimatiellae bacterium]|nr:cell envelope integrity protein TolA [Kiritimatiellia bacterium]